MPPKIVPGWRWRMRFGAGYLTGSRSTTGPFTAVLGVTTRCNLHCFACPSHAPGARRADTPGGHFPWPLFQRLCPELVALGARKLVFVGKGEPLLHPKLPDMLRLAKQCGLHLILVTNGTLLNGRVADACLEAPVDHLRVSLWASSAEEYAKNCAGDDAHLFHSVVEGLKAIARRRRERGSRSPWLTLHRPIDRESFRSLDGMVDLAREAGCDGLSFVPLRSVSGPHHQRGLAPQEEGEVVPILRRIDERARSLGLATNVPETIERLRIGENVWETVPCYMGWLTMRFQVNGDVVPCGVCREPLGNLHDASLAEIWNGPGYRRFRSASHKQEDIARIARSDECGYCSYVLTNARMHRFLRWVPF
jgi:radical SAM protein with 4Fe4S-binding SPASM domain